MIYIVKIRRKAEFELLIEAESRSELLRCVLLNSKMGDAQTEIVSIKESDARPSDFFNPLDRR